MYLQYTGQCPCPCPCPCSECNDSQRMVTWPRQPARVWWGSPNGDRDRTGRLGSLTLLPECHRAKAGYPRHAAAGMCDTSLFSSYLFLDRRMEASANPPANVRGAGRTSGLARLRKSKSNAVATGAPRLLSNLLRSVVGPSVACTAGASMQRKCSQTEREADALQLPGRCFPRLYSQSCLAPSTLRRAVQALISDRASESYAAQVTNRFRSTANALICTREVQRWTAQAPPQRQSVIPTPPSWHATFIYPVDSSPSSLFPLPPHESHVPSTPPEHIRRREPVVFAP